MICIAIVEDEKAYTKTLEDYLSRFTAENQVSFQISTFADGLDIVSDYKAEYDVILLDVQMKHLDGMETAEKIRSLDENVILVFITSTVQYAVQGYLVDALGYVVKPVPYLAFAQIVQKAVNQISQKREKTYLTIDVEGGHLKQDIAQITFIESQRHNVILHTEKGELVTPGPMKKLETGLAEKGFAKCHNAYLINLAHVIGVLQSSVLLTDNLELPVSRTYKKNFMDALTDYMGGIKR